MDVKDMIPIRYIVDTLPIANFNATEVCHNDITIFMDSSIGTSATVDQWS